jgi:hypothetical protein
MSGFGRKAMGTVHIDMQMVVTETKVVPAEMRVG